ncbi:hypothetical protein CXB49_07470 [Chromobacterium sp. ATCC 53434]|nr:hypothetical protein CXB49_07470 [Chromobacterium sp. ATCC 53434]
MIFNSELTLSRHRISKKPTKLTYRQFIASLILFRYSSVKNINGAIHFQFINDGSFLIKFLIADF